ncbi:MucBP domain-containing protein [Candidatus Enterococcus lemimoniae]|uniref:MucBP domain-containing protein n=1 Tax=Candidatus Enterococcus lemimoniae TaxID=1834167 RepID=A0ABZ2T6J8_9ENTE|nr:MucBP domain-containing protein [Enterococcus sp. 12C11_DIV0727]OTO71094.1 hypothetical protein A5866_003344 [Enterococcus sp. 12C11_DIV0727]
MHKKKTLCLLAGFVFFLSFLSSSIVLAAEDDSTSTIVYNYASIDTLTDEQRNNIIQGNPSETNLHDSENYLFVYQKEDLKTEQNKNSNVSGNKMLLKTGDTGSNKGLVTLGSAFILGSIVFFSWKKKQRKHFLLIFIFLGGSGFTSSFAYAIEQEYLREPVSVIAPKGTKETKKPEVISGYTYIGYIHTFDNNNVPIPEKKGTVIVNYQNENGDTLIPSEILEGTLGKTFETTLKDIEGYSYKRVEGNPKGVISETTQVVTYVYTKVPVAEGNILINYVDQEGNEIHESQIISGNIGDLYDASTDNYQLKIEGYTLDTTKLPSNIKGVIKQQKQEVRFVYNKEVQDATITIKFIDSDGNPFTLYNLMTYKNGSLIPRYPNLDKYHMQLDYNKQLYNQGEQVPNIVLQSKIDETYSLPEKMTFKILDAEGNEVSQVGSVNEDTSYSGIRYWQNYNQIPDNREGIVDSENIVITYRILAYVFSTPPDEE